MPSATRGERAKFEPAGPRIRPEELYLWPQRCCWSGSGPAYRGPDRRFCCDCQQPRRAPRCGVPRSRAWQAELGLRGLGKDGWTWIPPRRGVTVSDQRLHEPSRKRRRLRKEEVEKGTWLAARCRYDVAGCPPRAGWEYCAGERWAFNGWWPRALRIRGRGRGKADSCKADRITAILKAGIGTPTSPTFWSSAGRSLALTQTKRDYEVWFLSYRVEWPVFCPAAHTCILFNFIHFERESEERGLGWMFGFFAWITWIDCLVLIDTEW